MLIAAAGPPVSGNTEAEAVGVVVALAEGLGEPLADGKGVKGPPVVLAIGLALGVGLAVEPEPPGSSQAMPSSSASSLLGSMGAGCFKNGLFLCLRNILTTVDILRQNSRREHQCCDHN